MLSITSMCLLRTIANKISKLEPYGHHLPYFNELEDSDYEEYTRYNDRLKKIDVNEFGSTFYKKVIKLVEEQNLKIITIEYQQLELYVKALWALVDTIIQNEEGELLYFCCDCLFFWPKENIQLEGIKLDIFDAAINHKSYVARQTLRRLLPTSADLKQKLISKLETCDAKIIHHVLEFLVADYKTNQYFLMPETLGRILSKRLLEGIETSAQVARFIYFNGKYVYISFDSAIELLKNDKAAERAYDFLHVIASIHFVNEDKIKLIIAMFDTEMNLCKALNIVNVVKSTSNLNESPYFSEIIEKIASCSLKTHIVSVIFGVLNLDLNLLKQLMVQYPKCHAWLPSMSRFVNDEDIHAYIDRSLDNENYMLALTALECAKNVPTPFLSKICNLVGKSRNNNAFQPYDIACRVIYNNVKKPDLIDSGQINKSDLIEYLPTLIPKLIEIMEDDWCACDCIAVLFGEVKDKRVYASEIIPRLDRATRVQSFLAAELCVFDEYAQELERFYDGIHYCILDGKPLSLKYVKTMFLKMVNKNPSNFGVLFDNPKAKKLEYFITDVLVEKIKANRGSLTHLETLWFFCEKFQSECAQYYAWKYFDIFTPRFYIEGLLHAGKLIAPPDEIADKALQSFINYKNFRESTNEIVVFLYNNTSVPLHIKLIKTIIKEFLQESDQDNFTFQAESTVDAMNFLSFLVLNLHSRVDELLEHKDVLVSLMVTCLLSHEPPYDKTLISQLIKAILFLENSDEVQTIIAPYWQYYSADAVNGDELHPTVFGNI